MEAVLKRRRPQAAGFVQAAYSIDRRLCDLHARPDGVVTSWNAGAERFKGYRPKRSSASISRTSTPRRTARRGFRARCSRPRARRASSKARAGACARTAAASGRSVVIDRDPRRRRRADRLRQDHPRHDRADARRKQSLRESERTLPAAGPGRHRLRDLHARPEGHVTNWNAGAAAHQGLCRRRDHRAAFLAASTPTRIATPACPRRALRDRRRDGPLRGGGLARSQGRQPLLGERRHRRDPDDDGKLIGFAKITRDITERREAQLRLEETPRTTVPVAEDGSDRPADRRRRARLQQSADGHPRRPRISPCATLATRDG